MSQNLEIQKESSQKSFNLMKSIKVADIIRLTVIISLLAFALTTPGFLSSLSIRSLLSTMSFVECVAVGMTFITLSGNIMSFSIGAGLSAATVIFVALLPYGLFTALVATVIFSAVINGIQGWIIGYFRANPIIVSMAGYSLIIGIMTYFTQGRGLYIQGGEAAFFKQNLGPIPGPFIGLVLAVIVAQLILTYTRVGKRIYLTGSNSKAALAAGFEPWKTIVWAYVLSGVFAAIAAILMASRYSSGDLQHGIGLEFGAISAVLVGGTLIQGGKGSVLHTLLGTLLIAIFQAVLVLRGFSTEIQQLALGVVVLVVIMLQWKKDK